MKDMGSHIRINDVLPLLRQKLAFLSGGRDSDGGAILTFPSTLNSEKIKTEDLKELVLYLASVPSNEVLQLGFTIIVDMRGTTWSVVKAILKVIQDCFPTKINAAYVIKGDNFWQKQRVNFASNKFSFDVQSVSLESLNRAIEPRQLTQELGGVLIYDHDEWIEYE